MFTCIKQTLKVRKKKLLKNKLKHHRISTIIGSFMKHLKTT